MAGDTRDPHRAQARGPPLGATAPPGHVGNPKVYEAFNAPPKSANALPEGSGLNTAGAHTTVPTLAEAAKTVRLSDFQQVYMYPCARESLLNGIGGGFGIGGLRFLFGAPIFTSCSWAVGTFCLLGAASYEYCHLKRSIEKANMKRAVEIIDFKKAEKEAKLKAAEEGRRLAKEEEDRKAEEAKRKSWKFW